MPSHSTAILRRVAVLLLSGLPSCVSRDSGPPLVVQRDSAGIEIIEAMRPLWGDSSLWSIDSIGERPGREYYTFAADARNPGRPVFRPTGVLFPLA